MSRKVYERVLTEKLMEVIEGKVSRAGFRREKVSWIRSVQSEWWWSTKEKVKIVCKPSWTEKSRKSLEEFRITNIRNYNNNAEYDNLTYPKN